MSLEEQVASNAEKTMGDDVNELKSHIKQLEEQLAESQKLNAKHLKEAEEVDVLKLRSEDTLTRAKSIIFENTKVIKNQELQIQALNQQIESLKDVVSITKDLLEIRNLEVKQLENKIQCMADRHSAEKERHELMHKKLEQMIRHNGELKREYETQLCLFTALRERYNERELARGVVDELRGNRSENATANEPSAPNGEVQEEAPEEEANPPTEEKKKT